MTWTTTPKKRHVTKKQRQATLTRDHHTCQHCGWHDPTAKTLQIDHIKNLKTGGTNNPNNLQTLCKGCHNHKTQQEAQQAQNNWKHPTQRHPGLK